MNRLIKHLKKRKKLVLLSFIALFFTNLSVAQEYQPTKENLENREWYQDAKFGMFIHWGGIFCFGCARVGHGNPIHRQRHV